MRNLIRQKGEKCRQTAILSENYNGFIQCGSRGGGGGGWGPVPTFWIFFTKAKIMSKKLVLNLYEICLKMLETAILEIEIFKHFWGTDAPDPQKARVFGTRWCSPPF